MAFTVWNRIQEWFRPSLAIEDPGLGSPVVPLARAALQRSDFLEASRLLSGIRDLHEHYSVIDALGRMPGREAMFEQWLAHSPQDLNALLVNGANLINWAWEARTAQCARNVSRQAFDHFYARLKQAHACLNQAGSLYPTHALSWAFMIKVGRGLQFGKSVEAEIFQRAIDAEPTLAPAYISYLMSICRKWGGSDAQMFAFARQHAGRAPHLALLIPHAHLEYHMMLDDAAYHAYMKQPEVSDEVRAAFDAFRSTSGRFDRIRGANFFSMMFYFLGEEALARESFSMSEKLIAPIPWGYQPTPTQAYNHAARRCRAA